MQFLNGIIQAFFIASALIVSGGLCQAQSQSKDIRPKAKRLVGDELLTHFKGVTHDGAYRFTEKGVPRLHYRETTREDGRTVYEEEDGIIDGAWLIRRGALCFAYDSKSMAGGCFRVYKIGNCFYYYSELLPQAPDEIGREYWTARSVKDGEAPNCEPAIS